MTRGLGIGRARRLMARVCPVWRGTPALDGHVPASRLILPFPIITITD
jgi:hypothetical protein